MKERINVVKSFLPDEIEYNTLVHSVFKNNILTNNGPKCVELENKIRKFININEVTICANATLSIEVAIHAAGAAGRKIITTPFTYVATVTAPMWVGCEIIFADIDPETLCIDPASVAERMRNDIAVVMPVNIYGHPCDDEGIRKASGKATIIYDGAQAFGAEIHGRSLLDFGHFAVCSLHATKVYHSVEGGFIVSHSNLDRSRLCLMRAFGHDNDRYLSIGTNAKMSELHACMGLSLLDHFHSNLEARKKIDLLYRSLLNTNNIRYPKTTADFESNYGYFPIIFESEKIVLKVITALNEHNIFPRRYFYPALSALEYLNPNHYRCPVAEDIAPRVLCLPLYSDLSQQKAEEIADIVNKVLGA